MSSEKLARKKVNQAAKIKFDLNIRDLPWTEKQKEFIRIALNSKTRIVFVKGKAGSSKTILSTYCALQLLNQRKVSDIIFVRAAVESADSKLGHLPGDMDDKIRYYNLPFMDKLEELLGLPDIKVLHDQQKVLAFPVNFARGMHWPAKAIIVDEAQNLTRNELKTLITRLGEFSRMYILSDPEQSDLPPQKQGGCEYFQSLFGDEESVGHGIHNFEFTADDIMRSELCKYVVKKMDQAAEFAKLNNKSKIKATVNKLVEQIDNTENAVEWEPKRT